jgi:short-subunit dehydrogenase
MTARRVPITGASRGIGYRPAERLAGLGHEPVGLVTVGLVDRTACVVQEP